MCESKGLLVLVVILFFSISSQAQNAEVKFEIPGQATFSFDGRRIQVESSNTLLGHYVGETLTSGKDNTFLGIDAGKKNSQGSQNTFLGAFTGLNNEGDGNVFIGYQAGLNETNAKDKLYIANSDTSTPLIFGDFRNQIVDINNDLNVNRDLYVERRATIKSELVVEANASIRYLSINSEVPTLTFFAPSQGSFHATFNPSQDRFYLTDNDSEEVLEIKNGEVTLPQYASGNGGNVEMDASGKLIKSSLNRMVFNRFEFHQKDIFTDYTKLTRGVQFEDGTVVTGISALIRDNNTSGSSGVQNTAFVGLYRQDKFTGTNSTITPIYRIDANDTATGIHELFTQTILAQTGANVIDNDNYIYLIQIFYCDDCGVSEVEILE